MGYFIEILHSNQFDNLIQAIVKLGEMRIELSSCEKKLWNISKLRAWKEKTTGLPGNSHDHWVLLILQAKQDFRAPIGKKEP